MEGQAAVPEFHHFRKIGKAITPRELLAFRPFQFNPVDRNSEFVVDPVNFYNVDGLNLYAPRPHEQFCFLGSQACVEMERIAGLVRIAAHRPNRMRLFASLDFFRKHLFEIIESHQSSSPNFSWL